MSAFNELVKLVREELGFSVVVVYAPTTEEQRAMNMDPDDAPIIAIHLARDELAMTRSMMDYLINEKMHTA